MKELWSDHGEKLRLVSDPIFVLPLLKSGGAAIYVVQIKEIFVWRVSDSFRASSEFDLEFPSVSRITDPTVACRRSIAGPTLSGLKSELHVVY